MDTTPPLMDIERSGTTLVLIPRRDLSELDWLEIERIQREALQELELSPSLRDVIVDFSRTDYFGSSALGLLTRIRKHVGIRGGRMALCGVSAHEQDILAVTGLAGFWTLYPSREEAIQALGG